MKKKLTFIVSFTLFFSYVQAQFINAITKVDSTVIGHRDAINMFHYDEDKIGVVTCIYNESDQKYELWRKLYSKMDLSILDSSLIHSSNPMGRIFTYNWQLVKNGAAVKAILIEGGNRNGINASVSIFNADNQWSVSNRLYRIALPDSSISVTVDLIGEDLFYTYLTDLNAANVPSKTIINKIHLPTGSLQTQELWNDNGVSGPILIPIKIFQHPTQSSQAVLIGRYHMSQIYLINKDSLSVSQMIWLDIQVLMNQYQVNRPFWSRGGVYVDGSDMYFAGEVPHNYQNSFPFVWVPRGFLLKLNSQFEIQDISLYGESAPGASTMFWGMDVMPDCTFVMVGNTPAVNPWRNRTSPRSLFVARQSRFGRDSLIIYGHANHMPFQALGDSITGDLFILTHFQNPQNSEEHYLEVIKIPQFAISVLEQQQLARGLRLYPNPTTDFLDLADAAGLRGAPNWRIFDSQGREVQSGIWSNTRIDVRELAKGQYVFLMEADGQIFNTVFVKQ
jgi:hypothetical protein